MEINLEDNSQAVATIPGAKKGASNLDDDWEALPAERLI
jgi:hypothetical protein